MKTIEHPSKHLKTAWITLIRDRAEAAETMGCLHPDQLDLIDKRQWFKLLVPKIYGGLELSLPDALKLEEALSWADGSLGWTVTLCAGAGWFGGFLAETTAKEIFADKHVCLAGSGAPSGTATITENGYLIDGSWKFATGAKHATQFTVNCIIKQGNKTVLQEDGNPLIRSFIFNNADVHILKDWKTFGLVATGSHAFEIKQLEVGIERSFKIAADATVIHHPLYQYPFLQLAETTLAANISGMAIHFTDLCKDVFEERIKRKKLNEAQQKNLIQILNKCSHQINQARDAFYSAAENSWLLSIEKGSINQKSLHGVSKTSRALARVSRQCVDGLYPFCGLIAADPTTEINRVWRDLHTASQHSLLNLA